MHSSFVSTSLVMATVASAAVHTIMVGEGGLSYTPNSITAAKGDKVAFKFASSGHTATQGDFSNACQPLNAMSWNSGEVSPGSEEFFITINSTDPMYFYCSTPGHCQAGMAGAINAPSGMSADDFIAAAKKSSSSKAQSQVQGGVLMAPGSGSSSMATTTMASTMSMASSMTMGSSMSMGSSMPSAMSSSMTSPMSTASPGAAAHNSPLNVLAAGGLFTALFGFLF